MPICGPDQLSWSWWAAADLLEAAGTRTGRRSPPSTPVGRAWAGWAIKLSPGAVLRWTPISEGQFAGERRHVRKV